MNAQAYCSTELITTIKDFRILVQGLNLLTVMNAQAYCSTGLITIVIFYNHYTDSKLKMTDSDEGSSLLWYRVNYDNKRL